MASQLAIEITLENAASCMIAKAGGATGAAPTYFVTNANLIPEILEFDASYGKFINLGVFQAWKLFSEAETLSKLINRLSDRIRFL